MTSITSTQQSHSMTCPYCGNTFSVDPAASEPERDNATPDLLPSSKTQPLQPEAACFLELTVTQTGRRICLPPASSVYLGRRDERHSIYPDVDLTHDGGAAHGVSRQHACIHQRDDGIYVEDINSTNGTFINNQRLRPLQVYPLDYGDTLRLGRLELQVAPPSKPTGDHESASLLGKGLPLHPSLGTMAPPDSESLDHVSTQSGAGATEREALLARHSLTT